MRRIAPLLACLALLAVLPAAADAAIADRDLVFAAGGVLALRNGGAITNMGVSAVAEQPDGKVLAAGTAIHGGSGGLKATVWRFNADGTPDASFDGDGVAAFSLAGYAGVALFSLAIQDDGKIVVSGYAATGPSYTTIVARLGATGALDAGFGDPGTPGIAQMNCGGSGTVEGFRSLVLTDGAIFGAGDCDTPTSVSRMIVARLSSSGQFVSSWGVGGQRELAAGTSYSRTGGLAVDGAGRIVAAGHYRLASGYYNGMFTRIDAATGAIDGSFGSGGYRLIPGPDIATGMEPKALTILDDGRIAFAGSTDNDSEWLLGQLTQNGAIDPAFNGGTPLIDPLDEPATANGIVSLPGARAIAAGSFAQGTAAGGDNIQSLLAMRGPNGVLDPGFGAAGLLVDAYGGTRDEITALHMAPDGHVLALRVVDTDPTAATVFGYDIVRYSGTFVAPVVPTVPLGAKLKSPTKRKLKRSKFRKFSGSASGTGLSGVELAIGRSNSKLLKKSRRCLWVTSTRAKLKRFKAVKRRCATPGRWLRAAGTGAWSLKLRKSLPAGRYSVYLRAVGAGGSRSTAAKRTYTVTR